MSTALLGAALVLAIAFYLWWERSDRKREGVVAELAKDVAAMGDVVAASLSPAINPDICIGSGACVAACPEKDIIGLVGGRAKLVNPLGCIGHGACATACPVKAIRLVYGSKTRGVELPLVDEHFQTNQPGVYIAGELGGMGLIRNAVIQGRQAADHIVAGNGSGPPRRGQAGAFDVIVVGAGPAGVSASLRLLEAGLGVLLMDREGFGGTIAHYPRAKVVMTGSLELPLYGSVRRRTMSKEELVELWADIQAQAKPPFVTGELVTQLRRRPDGMWSVISDRGERHAANVILALGGRGSPRKLGVPGEELAKVSYRLLEPEPFEGQHVLVVGGGNSAVESALALSDFGRCASVSISYRKAQFARCRAENQSRIAQAIAERRVTPLFSSEVRRIEPASVRLEAERGQTGSIANDALIVQIGGTPPAELLKSFGIDLVTKFGER